MNSVVAAILLYRREKTLAMAEIIEDADFIFNYFKTKLQQKTTMTVPPTQAVIEQHIQGLRF